MRDKVAELKTGFELEKEILLDEVSRRVGEDKDKQIELLREREANLNLECIKYKSTIQQLAESESESQNIELLQKVECLERERHKLENELTLERTRHEVVHSDMAASVAVCEGQTLFFLPERVAGVKLRIVGRSDAATSPLRRPDNLSKSSTTLVQSGMLNVDQCKIGDIVLVIWDSMYRNYRILQDSTHLYFLHSDCVEPLGLTAPGTDSSPKMYCMGKVSRKDYCHAKKVTDA